MSLGIYLLLGFTVMLIAVLPIWPHSRGWGIRPAYGLGLVVIILLVLVLLDQIRTGSDRIIYIDRNFQLDSPIQSARTKLTIAAVGMKVTNSAELYWRYG
ncbi:MAG: DUF3309 family protein [Gammaproteobacteria bacterium]